MYVRHQYRWRRLRIFAYESSIMLSISIIELIRVLEWSTVATTIILASHCHRHAIISRCDCTHFTVRRHDLHNGSRSGFSCNTPCITVRCINGAARDSSPQTIPPRGIHRGKNCVGGKMTSLRKRSLIGKAHLRMSRSSRWNASRRFLYGNNWRQRSRPEVREPFYSRTTVILN